MRKNWVALHDSLRQGRAEQLESSGFAALFVLYIFGNSFLEKNETKRMRMEFGNMFSVLILLCFLFDRPCTIVWGFSDKHKRNTKKKKKKKKKKTT